MEMRRAVLAGIESERALDFETFFEDEYERLLRAMYVLCRNRSEAEDLTQGAMVRAFERWDTVKSADSPTAYLYKVAFNSHRSAMRRARLAIRHQEPDRVPPDGPDSIAERRYEVLLALRSLPRTQREALLLVEWVGMTSEEAGSVLGIEPESVRGRIHRARISLRERFGGLSDG
jgi:RNA polymerase sigma-70 factor (ECF subfamily)